VMTLRQDWPYVGLPSMVRKSRGADTLLSQVGNTFFCIDPATGGTCTVAAGNRYFPFIALSVESGADLNGAALPTVTTTSTYDAFGNPTGITLADGDHSRTTAHTYTNDTENWLLGRLTRSTVRSTSP
jgi:hypothetical protein